ncbi:FAD/FMN-containing dehydrogenase [Monaibacterium marinum]|uniref:FAD/FMN-containing dehydrogenase n=2 Tax=Pontivivens marinum TaxID=1690039 RepID=A0A2C9CPJ6_9RHOB|nr:FAD/FMN-containing dehydrogenase [Monaibacterium marinum]
MLSRDSGGVGSYRLDMTLAPATPAFLDRLAQAVPAVRIDPPSARWLEEPRGKWTGQAAAILRPSTVEDVSTILRMCNEAGIGVIPYGGGTGLVGGQLTSAEGVLVLSLDRMATIRASVPEDNMIEVEAGVTLQAVQQAAADAGRLFPLSIASEGTACIGGILGTNAGGTAVLRYGNARDLVLGIEAVLADGTIIRDLKRLRKDNTGYDLRHLLIGSEGTLGIITAASLRLLPRPAQRGTAFLAVDNPAGALSLLHKLHSELGEVITAFELMHRQGLDFLAEFFPNMAHPLENNPEWMVLVEVSAATGCADALQDALGAAFEDGLISDAVLAQSEAQRDALWAIRETIPEGNRMTGAIMSHDISVPLSQLADFVARGNELVRAIAPDARINCFGHVGDGNLHYNVFPAPGRNRAEYKELQDSIQRAVHDLTHELGGSVSAEHGVGRFKVGDLERYSDPGRLRAQRAIKAAMDPNGILNPGAVLSGVPLG